MGRRKKSASPNVIDLFTAIFSLFALIFSFLRYLHEKLTQKNGAPVSDCTANTTESLMKFHDSVKFGSAKRLNAKYEIKRFLDTQKKTKLIIFDLETNGIDSSFSVLSCSAIKYDIDPVTYEMSELECFDRYYYPVEAYNLSAISKNGLTEEVITRNRGDCAYPRHFLHDEEFKQFCQSVSRIVAHNISFDTRFVPHLASKRKKFCTMMINADIVAAEFLEWKGEWKWPTLAETANFYGIQFQKDGLHRSMNDARVTAGIFRKMLEAVKTE